MANKDLEFYLSDTLKKEDNLKIIDNKDLEFYLSDTKDSSKDNLTKNTGENNKYKEVNIKNNNEKDLLIDNKEIEKEKNSNKDNIEEYIKNNNEKDLLIGNKEIEKEKNSNKDNIQTINLKFKNNKIKFLKPTFKFKVYENFNDFIIGSIKLKDKIIPCSWNKKGKIINSIIDSNFNLTLFNEWFLEKDNYPCLLEIYKDDKIVKVIAYKSTEDKLYDGLNNIICSFDEVTKRTKI